MQLVLLSGAKCLPKVISEDVPLLDGVEQSALLLIIVVLVPPHEERGVLFELWLLPRKNLLDERLVDCEVLIGAQDERRHSCDEGQESS